MDARSILAIGTGVGIEIVGQDLHVAVARVRPGGIKVLGTRSSPLSASGPPPSGAPNTPASCAAWAPATWRPPSCLPRTEVIVRQVALPGVAARDLARRDAASRSIRCTPTERTKPQHTWARLPGTETVLVGIARKVVVERYAEMFIEAGIKVAVLLLFRGGSTPPRGCSSAPPAGGFLAIGGDGSWRPTAKARRGPCSRRSWIPRWKGRGAGGGRIAAASGDPARGRWRRSCPSRRSCPGGFRFFPRSAGLCRRRWPGLAPGWR